MAHRIRFFQKIRRICLSGGAIFPTTAAIVRTIFTHTDSPLSIRCRATEKFARFDTGALYCNNIYQICQRNQGAQLKFFL